MSKPGRNDPCPCGSGKKYKKCCEPKETQRKILTAHKIDETTSQKVSGLTNLFKASVPKTPPPEEEKKTAEPPLDEPPTPSETP